jgi:hypothetical protein
MRKYVAGCLLLLALTTCRQKVVEPPPAPAPPVEAPAPAGPAVTKAEYDKVLYGMTLTQVVDIIGAEPSETRSEYKEATAYTGPSLTVWKRWSNGGDSFAEIGFASDKVAEKVESKLP